MLRYDLKFIDGEAEPNTYKIIFLIAKDNGEALQIHGAKALLALRVSTQVPMSYAYYTSGKTRVLKVGPGSVPVRFIHVNPMILQHRRIIVEAALSAAWFEGKTRFNVKTAKKIQDALTDEQFDTLLKSDMPKWMREAFVKSLAF